MTYDHVTKLTHEPFFCDLVSAHNQTCDHMSPMSMHDLESKHVSPTIVHGDQTT